MELKVCFLGAVRRRTFICCLNIQISTSSAVRDRNRSAIIQTMSLTRSLIPQEHRPILDQPPFRLSLRQGQAYEDACCNACWSSGSSEQGRPFLLASAQWQLESYSRLPGNPLPIPSFRKTLLMPLF